MKKIITVVIILALMIAGTVAYAEGALTQDQQSLFDSKKEHVDSLVNSERITQEKADEFMAALEQRLIDGTCDGDFDQDGENCENRLAGDGEGLGGGLGNRNFGANSEQYGMDSKGFGGRGRRTNDN